MNTLAIYVFYVVFLFFNFAPHMIMDNFGSMISVIAL